MISVMLVKMQFPSLVLVCNEDNLYLRASLLNRDSPASHWTKKILVMFSFGWCCHQPKYVIHISPPAGTVTTPTRRKKII